MRVSLEEDHRKDEEIQKLRSQVELIQPQADKVPILEAQLAKLASIIGMSNPPDHMPDDTSSPSQYMREVTFIKIIIEKSNKLY